MAAATFKYTGSKNGHGVMQAIINNIPGHNRYFELFAGSASVFMAKKPASFNYLCDINPDLVSELVKYMPPGKHISLKTASAFSVIESFPFQGDDFIYLDPPYPFSSRRSSSKIYKHEFTDADHYRLLSSIRDLPAMIMISTRQCDLYDCELRDWRKIEISTSDRGGAVKEIIYMNYPAPMVLHQYDLLGIDATDRQRISRKIKRLELKLTALPALERLALIKNIVDNNRAAVEVFLSMNAGK